MGPQTHPGERLQQVLDALVAAGAPSALGQLRDESGCWSRASGVAQLERQDPVAADGWFRVGSVTKTFTATLVLQLVHEGKLGLDDTVERWLAGVVPDGHKITIRQLLNHTSGLYNYTDDLPGNAEIVNDRHEQRQPSALVAAAVRHNPLFAPGTSRSYCNTCYILLGMVIEKVAGRAWETELKHRILHPLDLRQTLVPSEAQSLPEPHAHGYLPVDGQPIDITVFNPSWAGTAGGMASTAEDLNRFYHALLSGGLLAPAELQAMQTTIPTDIPEVRSGLGLGQWTLPSGLGLWGHVGGFFGYQTFSHHTIDGGRQLTASVTLCFNSPPAAMDLLTGVFGDEDPVRQPH